MTELRQRVIEDLRIRKYADTTIERYVDVLEKIARHFRRSPDLLSLEDVRSYLVFLVETKNASFSLLKQVVCALRFLNRVTLGREFPCRCIPFPRKRRTLPIILSCDEVARLLAATRNLKHLALLSTAYETGVRVSELTRLKLTDVDSARMVLHVRQGKGHKDRDVKLSQELLDLLRAYWLEYRPREWLFPGQHPHQHISKDSIQKVCQVARLRAGLTKRATPHSLRHAFATHSLELGVSPRLLQEDMGHECQRTLSTYTHVTNQARQAKPSLLAHLPKITTDTIAP